jgi:thiazole synthase
MPLASLIGSGMGILNPGMSLIIEQARAGAGRCGVGTASDAAIAMELGCDGVLMNTAIAGAIRTMARAAGWPAEAGPRPAFLAGRIPRKFAASPSSPMAGRVA